MNLLAEIEHFAASMELMERTYYPLRVRCEIRPIGVEVKVCLDQNGTLLQCAKATTFEEIDVLGWDPVRRSTVELCSSVLRKAAA